MSNDVINYLFPFIIIVINLILYYKKSNMLFFGSLILLVFMSLIIGLYTIDYFKNSRYIYSAPIYSYVILNTWQYIVGILFLIVMKVLKNHK